MHVQQIKQIFAADKSYQLQFVEDCIFYLDPLFVDIVTFLYPGTGRRRSELYLKLEGRSPL